MRDRREPIATGDSYLEPDVRDAEWYRVAQAIADVRAAGSHAWAEATLAALQATIEETRQVTAAQWSALTAIVASKRSPARNFDPWGYGRRR